ncbi:LacI family DNA-binding transcriptional regulator [Cohnella nanjingensis]|uniref:LacI family DNA-binding transcriptional regulator n=1 Tax=Cohnella nanjingensis TaxID=1387779 RepID=A0A7X0VH53_9BACL|nr:LacI family DNA-binding transcriptional regulator [Cohnella nanjingensis]MBB6673556.1 LacI family DNA-binding transcriptional regulator [Cohnella nanjingensis]
MTDNRIVDVARRASVSVATVSRVLNDSPLVSPKTKTKVMQAIEEMKYTPNASAKNLRSKKTMTLGVLVSDILISYYTEIIKGIENAANRLHYKLIICDAQNEKDKEIAYMSLLMDRTVDAMILVTPLMSDREIAAYADNGYQIGLIGRAVDHPDIPCVLTDNVKLAREVVNHLIGQGHGEIAFLSGYADAIDSYERLEGYMKALRDARLPFDPGLIENGNFNETGGYAAFKRLLEKGARFTAIFAANDEMAIGVYRACEELEIRIPGQLAVVGVDNERVSKYITPKMSTVEQPKYAMGALLAEKLIDRVNASDEPAERIFKLDSQLMIRASSQSNVE